MFVDKDGILRMTDRLVNSSLQPDAKFPILLEKDSYLTDLIILDCHKKVKHSKVKDTLNELRSTFWVPQGRRTVYRVLRSCTICNKFHSKAFEKMSTAPLPKFRVETTSPYTACGIDYLGALLVKDIFNQGNTLYKVHIALFTCASSRAVHLDLVPDLSCIAFVRCLKRFICRYGVSKLYISDNAKCFVGPELTSFVHQINGEWKYILERAPWWNGFCERLV